MNWDKYEGALIDMDGVLYDSMPGHTLAWQRMMSEAGIECTRDEFYLYEGMTGKATIDLIFRRERGAGVSDEEATRLYSVKSKYFHEWGNAPVMPGADRMLRALGALGLTRVLVTGSGQASLLDKLNRDYPGVFTDGYRVTAHDVSHGKPDPEPYLKGASLAGAAPDRCIVVENAPLGVRAGKAAGCFTIAVTTGPIPREAFEREGADMIFPDMNSFADWLERQVAERRPADWLRQLNEFVEKHDYDRLFLLTDKNVSRLLPEMDEKIHKIEVTAGEGCKNLDELAHVWRSLTDSGATRRSLLVNVGGGAVSDLGGLAAGTFKRGMAHVNVPTTLLAMADAAIGGKTAIDFHGLKNEIGIFKMPETVIVDTAWLRSLSHAQLCDGLAEVIKTTMLGSPESYNRLLELPVGFSADDLSDATIFSARYKERIVAEDPKEQGIRRVLNLGHTAGHAFESYASECGHPVSHGTAVAHGLLVALILSVRYAGLAADLPAQYAAGILKRHYRPLNFDTPDINPLIELMMHDKKNRHPDLINVVLLRDIGTPAAPVDLPSAAMHAALSEYFSIK